MEQDGFGFDPLARFFLARIIHEPLLEGVLPAESAAKLNKRVCCWIDKSKSAFALYLSAKLISVNNPG